MSRFSSNHRRSFTVTVLALVSLLCNSGLFAAPSQQAYFKASNAGAGDEFGTVVAVSGDTMVVGAPAEDSNGTQADNSVASSGAAYVFVRQGGIWTQQAYLKAHNAAANDRFGYSVAISGDTIVVGANGEDGSASGSGAAYVFVRTGSSWAQQAYLKASNPGSGDGFGASVAIAGQTIVVGAALEDSNGTSEADDSSSNAGAAYVFVRSGSLWTQQGYLKASNAGEGDQFGASVAIDGESLVIGAPQEDSSATGVSGDQNSASAANSGAAYVFTRASSSWTQQSYLKASNTGNGDQFGFAVAIFGDTIAVSANAEDSAATGISGNESSNSASNSGAVYVFTRVSNAWGQEAYVKASNTGLDDAFGQALSLSGDVLVVGAFGEDSNATGVDAAQNNNLAPASGAAYAFERVSSVWSQEGYLKAGNTEASDQFGRAVAVSGRTAVVGANFEGSAATGVNGDASNNSANTAGAAYAFYGLGPVAAEPDLDVEDALGQLLADESSGVDFGLVQVGSTGSPKTFTLQNRGSASLTLSSVTTSGVAASDFIVSLSGTAMQVAAGSSTTFTVAFAPSASGARSTTLVIVSDDPDENPYQITLIGAALPEIAVAGNSVNIASGDSTPSSSDFTDFGRASVAGATVRKAFRITNVGTAALTVGGATLSGNHASDFAVATVPATTVAPGAFTTLELEFDPSALGLRTATVSFANNDGNENPFTFAIQGTGTGPGLPDSAFGTAGIVKASFGGDDRALGLALQSDGKAIVAGYADNGTYSDFALARILSNGNLDTSFGTSGKATTDIAGSNDRAQALLVQPDGKIIAAGFAHNGSNEDVALVRYLANGSLDTAFGTDGIVTTQVGATDDRANAIALQTDGKIIIVGSTHNGSNSDLLVARYLANGALDTSFGNGGKVAIDIAGGGDEATSVVALRDGR
ncbi:MAG: choice-of-anchor D domain-containing protein, partial [Roseimicrobium sp.]